MTSRSPPAPPRGDLGGARGGGRAGVAGPPDAWAEGAGGSAWLVRGPALSRPAGRLRALHQPARVLRLLAAGTGALRLLVAAALLGMIAWVLSWRLLWEGPAGSDTLFHLQLATWVSASWPRIDWWFRWDASGLSYREGYPLAAHWVVAGLSRAGHLGIAGALQTIQFLVSPLCAV